MFCVYGLMFVCRGHVNALSAHVDFQSCVHLEQQCVVAAQLTQHDRAQLLVLQQSHSQLLSRLQGATDKYADH